MKKLVLLTIHLALFSQLTAIAQSSSIKGRLLNASRDSAAVAGGSVSLMTYADGMEAPQPVGNATSDRDGRFLFQIPRVDTTVEYLLTAENQGIQYYAESVHFTDFTPVTRDLAVYDTTHSSAMVVAFMHHLFLQDNGKVLAIRETRVLNNPTTRTIVNALADSHESNALFRFVLPLTAQNINTLGGHFGNELQAHGRVVYDVGAFQPGNRQISFTYEIPWQKDRAQLDFEFSQMTRTFDLFLADANLTVRGEGLTDYGPFNIRGVAYQRYGLSDVRPLQKLSVVIERKGAARKETSSTLLLGIALLLLFAGLAASRLMRGKDKKPLLSASDRQKWTNRRKELIEKIARLDLETDPSEDSPQERQVLFSELYRIERLLHPDKPAGKPGKK